MEDDAAHRNTPLLPRSASFGERGMLDPLHGPLHRATANLRSACDGDLLAVRSACLLGGVSTFAVGMMGVLNPFAVLSPLHLLTCLYLLPISLLGVAIELDVPALAPIQRWLTFWLRGLTLLSGKGALYIVTGTLAAGLGDPIGLAVGVLDMAAGAACLAANRSRGDGSCGAVAQRRDGELGAPGSRGQGGVADEMEVPRQAFRRRVPFGMSRLDPAELHTLCQELGVQLDARARSAAIARLDPHGEAAIEEAAFLEWWVKVRPEADASGMGGYA